ncbi:hypothetical protein [Roseofilum sp. Belize Diploria]|uniref:hypothetical protein n=1 Tax=Roseofilum sp. Belize Diploria TaxID=2821501 RepID=UPI001B20F8F3|nr:hypothetical protein [Roseofilum sp. Belize Diploria]MBP0008073.1 hypothetical protein [Roseofilum sp. Belize Diploria]
MLYRCTRNAPYQWGNNPSRNNPKGRQGHYIQADFEQEALKLMAQRFPEETTQGFTVETWQ